MELALRAVFSCPWNLLAGFALGLLLCAKCLVQMAFRQCPRLRWLEVAAGLGAFVLAFILGLDALDDGRAQGALPTLFWMPAGFGLGLAFVTAHFGMSLLHVRGRQLALQPVAWLAVALTLAATAWSSHRYAVSNLKIEIVKASYFAGDGELETVRSFVAVTDRGREVELFRWRPNQARNAAHLGQPLPEFGPANCHGWVFTSGEYFLKCEGVEQVLVDNGYEACQSPQAGDLIVYRDSSGGITHTGLVRAASLGGTPIIESKWGLRGRFVHPPEMQPYGNRYGYYRCARQGHTLAILRVRPTMSIARG